MTGWLTAEREYEGFPLMLRRPATVDRQGLQILCTELLTTTHTFAKRKPNGLPEPAYNKSLIDFDLAIQRAFNTQKDGTIVLIETFGGERNYYFYVSSSVAISDRLVAIREQFPAEQLESDVEPDPNWDFIDRYERDYF